MLKHVYEQRTGGVPTLIVSTAQTCEYVTGETVHSYKVCAGGVQRPLSSRCACSQHFHSKMEVI